MTIENNIKGAVRDIQDFPLPGVTFKDITPILLDPKLCHQITKGFCTELNMLQIDCVAAVESRGFLFGMLIAQELQVPFIPIRKKGKLPHKTIEQSYNLEYGSAVIEMHHDAIKPGQRVLLHDDLLATGGTIDGAAKLILKAGGTIEAMSFIINLSFLNGDKKLQHYSDHLIALATY